MKLSEIKNYLLKLKKADLEKLIIELYNLNKQNKEYLSSKVKPDKIKDIHIKYKKIIKDEFYPEKGEAKLRYFILKDAINNFKKVCNDPELIADLMIYYVENGIDFTNDYGDIDETFYIKMENMYQKALEYIFKNNLEKKYIERCLKIYENTEGIGWGFNEGIGDLFFEYYQDA
jgi:hypothetical protein